MYWMSAIEWFQYVGWLTRFFVLEKLQRGILCLEFWGLVGVLGRGSCDFGKCVGVRGSVGSGGVILCVWREWGGARWTRGAISEGGYYFEGGVLSGV